MALRAVRRSPECRSRASRAASRCRCSMISRSSGSAIPSSAAMAFAFQARHRGRSPATRRRPGHRLVGGRDVPVLAALPFASLISTQRRACHSAGSAAAEDGVDPRALPLAAGEVDRLVAGPRPSGSARRGRVDHLVVLGGRPVGLLEQRPGVVEQVDGELSGASPGRAPWCRRVVVVIASGSSELSWPRMCRTRWSRNVRASIRARCVAQEPPRSAGSSVASRSRISRAGPRGRAAGRSSGPSRVGRAGRGGSS